MERMVTEFMGLPSGDPRRPGVLDILNRHYEATTGSPATRLQSTFVVACLSPSITSLGI